LKFHPENNIFRFGIFAFNLNNKSLNKINPEAQKTIRKFFFQVRIIFVAVIIGIFFFAFAIWMITGYGAYPTNPGYDDVLKFAAPVSAVAFLLLSYRLYARSIEKVLREKSMHEKMMGYRYGVLFRLVCLDGAAFSLIISFMFTCNELYLYLLTPVLLVGLTSFPSPEKFIRDMQLNSTEEQVIRDHV
jgi:magnesium-transporting ATPase (P-type)